MNDQQQRKIIASILIVAIILTCGCDKKNDTSRADGTNSVINEESHKLPSTETTNTHINELKQENHTTTKRFLINPGVGIGMLCFDDNSSKIEELIGIPELVKGGIFYVYPGLTVIAQEGKVYQITCVDDKGPNGEYKCPCRTLKGIEIGSTEQMVIQAYGHPNTKLHDSSQYSGAGQWLYREKGMTIGIVNNKVYIMCFKKPLNN